MREDPGARQRRRSEQIPQQRRPGRRPERSQRNQRPQLPSSENRWFRAILLVLAAIGLSVFLAFFVLRSATDLFGLEKPDMQVEVEIPEGSDIGDIAALLGRKGIVLQPFTFRLYAGLKTKGDTLYPGTYLFNTNMGYNEIIKALRSEDVFKEEVRITFIEGKTLGEIAEQLEEERVCDAEEFIDYLQTADFGYEFEQAIPGSPLRFHRLEGYVFPDTYDFYVGENVSSVARKFLRNFNDKMTDALQAQMQEMNMTLDETIILASIIQREAGQEEDMRMVSSVFHNRLGNPGTYPKLQSDVTIFYVENDIKPYLERTNQAMYDAYNTYVCDGLPVGAICNPGLNAIRAALNPSKSDFNFFVTDAKSEFYYAVNEKDHYRNVETAKSVEGNQAHGIGTQIETQ